jgi:threonine/homoserine/homoserine lactone efflux protein
MSTIGHYNELRRYNAQRRAERIQNRIAAAFFVAFAVYIILGAV